VLTQVDTGSFVDFHDLLKVGALPQPRLDLGHAIAARAPLYNGKDTMFATQALVYKLRKLQRTMAQGQLQDANILKVLNYLTLCLDEPVAMV
jgi:hypothetical protein